MQKKYLTNHHSFLIKTLNPLEIEYNCLHLVKNIYENSTSNIILNGKRLNAFLNVTYHKFLYVEFPF